MYRAQHSIKCTHKTFIVPNNLIVGYLLYESDADCV